MVERNVLLKCADCGMVVETLVPCNCGPDCVIACCGKPMQQLDPKTADFSTEKHVPIPAPQQSDDGMKVVVGSVPHPMTPEHFIVWIEVQNGPYLNRKYLKPGEAPEALFHVKLQKGMVIREYCNIHGLWSYEVK